MAIDVYIEAGKKRVFAAAMEWPGWCRAGKDEIAALQALLDYGPRYAEVLTAAAIRFKPPVSLSELKVVERLKGGSGTDFGVPMASPKADQGTADAAEVDRHRKILLACWSRFDAAAKAAKGRKLRTGPRGGGRDLDKMVEHVREAEEAYVGGLGWWNFC